MGDKGKGTRTTTTTKEGLPRTNDDEIINNDNPTNTNTLDQ